MFGRPTSADIIRAQTNAMAGMIRAAAGIPPGGFCHVEMWYPTNGKWYLVRCPLRNGHGGLHADENMYPFFTDEDVAFFNQQYRIVTEA